MNPFLLIVASHAPVDEAGSVLEFYVHELRAFFTSAHLLRFGGRHHFFGRGRFHTPFWPPVFSPKTAGRRPEKKQ
jgi:hypothetical protein